MTHSRNATSAILLLLAPLAQAQELPELLEAVDAGKAQQLVEYNSPWLQVVLYSAKRFRIVAVDTGILMKDDDFTVTLFDDLAPLHLTKDAIHRREHGFAWNTLVLIDVPDVLTRLGARQTMLFSGLAWDTDESGRAFESSNNRSRLNKRVFYSVMAHVQLLGSGITYGLVPLQYTPKYHVLFEVDPEKVVPILTDRVPGEVVERTPADQVKLSNYEIFIRSLPPDRNMPVVEELQ